MLVTLQLVHTLFDMIFDALEDAGYGSVTYKYHGDEYRQQFIFEPNFCLTTLMHNDKVLDLLILNKDQISQVITNVLLYLEDPVVFDTLAVLCNHATLVTDNLILYKTARQWLVNYTDNKKEARKLISFFFDKLEKCGVGHAIHTDDTHKKAFIFMPTDDGKDQSYFTLDYVREVIDTLVEEANLWQIPVFPIFKEP